MQKYSAWMCEEPEDIVTKKRVSLRRGGLIIGPGACFREAAMTYIDIYCCDECLFLYHTELQHHSADVYHIVTLSVLTEALLDVDG